MDMIIGVSPCYYDLTHRVVSQINDEGLAELAEKSQVPINKLRIYARDPKKRKIDAEYVPVLYAYLFKNITPLQALNYLNKNKW